MWEEIWERGESGKSVGNECGESETIRAHPILYDRFIYILPL